MKINAAYYSREALTNFRKNWVLSMGAVTAVALCLIVIGSIMFIAYMGNQLINKVESQIEIEIFLKDNAPYNRIQALEDKILSWPEVKKVNYVSKESALKKFKIDFKDNPEVLQNLQGNPLPSSFRVWLRNPRTVKGTVKRIKQLGVINELVADKNNDIKFGSQYVSKLFTITRGVSIAAAGIIILLIFVSLVLITNTIRLAIFARRKEIGIMKLVGASNWFIRVPFLLEGVIEGALGAVIAILILGILYRAAVRSIIGGKWLVFMRVPLDQNAFIVMLLVLALSGVLIGSMGSAIALRRFLKV